VSLLDHHLANNSAEGDVFLALTTLSLFLEDAQLPGKFNAACSSFEEKINK